LTNDKDPATVIANYAIFVYAAAFQFMID